jgi:regulator of replication initiation timing
MSASNYPSATNTSQPPKKDNRGIIYGVLIAALLGTWGYIIYDKSKTKEVIQQKDVQYASLDSVRNQLMTDYQAAEIRLDKMTSENSRLDSLVKTRDKDVDVMRARIKTLINKQGATAADLAEARKLINQLNGKIEEYVQEIERLKGENQTLTTANQTLTTEKQQLSDTLVATQTVKKDLEGKVDVGSTLNASNFQIAAINQKSSGKEVTTTKAKRADKFRITFDVENRLATTGTKDLYVVVTNPDGKVVTEDGLGSGTFTSREEGDKTFTNKVSVDYEQGKRKSVSFDLKQTEKYKPGTYKVDVYQNGFKIGDGTVTLKKGGIFG